MSTTGPRVIVKNINRRYRINERAVRRISEKILKLLNRPRKSGLEVIFLSDALMRRLNKRYKDRIGSTDVLSFDLDSFGEILISSDTAMKNSRIFDTPFAQELVLYVIHGILHLSGYDDKTASDRKRMSVRESAVLKELCKCENLSKVLMQR